MEPQIIVCTDLDGCLLNKSDYSYDNNSIERGANWHTTIDDPGL